MFSKSVSLKKSAANGAAKATPMPAKTTQPGGPANGNKLMADADAQIAITPAAAPTP